MSMSVSMEAAPVHGTRDLLSTPATCAATSHAESGSPADAGHCPETPKPLIKEYTLYFNRIPNNMI